MYVVVILEQMCVMQIQGIFFPSALRRNTVPLFVFRPKCPEIHIKAVTEVLSPVVFTATGNLV